MNKIDLVDIYKTLYPTTVEYIYLSSTYETLTKIDIYSTMKTLATHSKG